RRLAKVLFPSRIRSPWAALAFDAVKLGLEAQHVIALRLTKIASGHRESSAEVRRMIAEKPPAFAKAQTQMTTALSRGIKAHAAARKAMRTLTKTVRANRRRLTRG
ncbi:MAG TPA: hypothetical protein VEK55_15430, partial [Xanthobacteraceae bacterium]|nr:hypothetical protein [Xanthobacteraceae bacterium]